MSMKYRIVWCVTLNPLGSTMEAEFDDLHDVIAWCISNRNTSIERLHAGYSVYAVNEDGSNGETLLNWQRDGKNIFGLLRDPENPAWFFAADPHAIIPAADGELTPDEFAELYAPAL